MQFDFNRYDKRRFHKDDKIDKKVKTLLLYYDYKVIENKLNLGEQLVLLDDWIDKFVEHELYEVIPIFKLKHKTILKEMFKKNNQRLGILTYLKGLLPIKLKKFLKSRFNSK